MPWIAPQTPCGRAARSHHTPGESDLQPSPSSALLLKRGRSLLLNLVAEAGLPCLFSAEVKKNGKEAKLHVGSLEHPKSHPESGKCSADP